MSDEGDQKSRGTILRGQKDWSAFKIDTRCELDAKDHWHVVDGSTPRPQNGSSRSEDKKGASSAIIANQEQKEWDSHNKKALNIIVHRLSKPYKIQYTTIKYAAALWKALCHQHESNSLIGRWEATIDLARLTLARCNNNVTTYTNRFSQLRDEQIVANGSARHLNWPDESLVMFYIAGLQTNTRWEQFVLSFRQIKGTLPTLEETMQLAREHGRLTKSIENDPGSSAENAIVLTAESQKKQHGGRSTNKQKKTYQKGSCSVHPEATNHTNEGCFVQHPEKTPDWVIEKRANQAKGNSSEAKTKVTLVSITTSLYALSAHHQSPQWAVDSGANEHCCNDLTLLTNRKEITPLPLLGASGAYTCTTRGDVDMEWLHPDGSKQPVRLTGVLFVKSLPINLLSANLLRSKGLYFSNLDCCFKKVSTNEVFGSAPIQNGLNILRTSHSVAYNTITNNLTKNLAASTQRTEAGDETETQSPSTSESAPISASNLWHLRLGHAGYDQLKRLQSVSTGMEDIRFTESPECDICNMTKSQRVVSRAPQQRPSEPGYELHADVVGRVTPSNRYQQDWVTLITDGATRMRWVYLHQSKGESYDSIRDHLTWMANRDYNVRVIRIDGGGEFGGNRLKNLCKDKGIELQTTAPYTPEQNGIAESSNKVVFTKARALMLDSGLPIDLWDLAVQTSTYIANRSPSRVGQTTPQALFYKTTDKADLSHLRRFGCLAYFHKTPYQMVKSQKFSPRAIRCFMVGYQGTTNYRLWFPESRKFTETPHVRFNEAITFKTGFKWIHNLADLDLSVWDEISEADVSPNLRDFLVDFDPFAYAQNPEESYQIQVGASSNSIDHPAQRSFHDPTTGGEDIDAVGITQNLESSSNTPGFTTLSPNEDFNASSPGISQLQPDPRTLEVLDPAFSGEELTNDHGDTELSPIAPLEHSNIEAQSDEDALLPSNNDNNLEGVLSTTENAPPVVAMRPPTITRAPERRWPRRNRLRYETDYKDLHNKGKQALTAIFSAVSGANYIEPKTFNEAMRSPESAQWHASMEREVHQLEEQETWSIVPRLPPGRVLIKGRWVYKIKRNPDHSIKEYKSRWVVKGFMQELGIDYTDTYAATLRTPTFRILFALAAYYGWAILQADVTGAFLHSLLQHDIYVEAPHGFFKGLICKLKKSLYGLKQAPFLWYQTFARALEDLGFLSLNADACCFTNKGHDVFVLVFVDDIQFTGPNVQSIEALRKGLNCEFIMKDVELDTYLGLQIERDLARNVLRLHQRPYLEKILDKYAMRQSKPVPTPMKEEGLLPHEGDVNTARQQWYASTVGSLNYLAINTRPDILFALSRLSRHLANPSEEHEMAVKRVFRYLNGTLDHGLLFQKQLNEPFAFAYSDADWAGDIETRRSTSGSLFILAGASVAFKSRLQSVITTSSTEAEYSALFECLKDARWFRGLLIELGFDSSDVEPLLVLEDNQSTIALTKNHANSNRTKHVDVRNHYCRQEYNLRLINLQYIATDLQAADGLTKPLGPNKWSRFLALLRMSSSIKSSFYSEARFPSVLVGL